MIHVKLFFLQQKKRTIMKNGIDLRKNVANLFVMLPNIHNKVLFKYFIPTGEQGRIASDTLLG